MVDLETLMPVTTEALKYGKRVRVMALPADDAWRTDKGIETVGPRYFGYDVDFEPLEELVKRRNAVMYKIGIDVGGTNTDAVILDENQQLIHSVKMPTSEDIETGITESLHRVLSETGIDVSKVTHAMLGTTQCTNAIVERKN